LSDEKAFFIIEVMIWGFFGPTLHGGAQPLNDVQHDAQFMGMASLTEEMRWH